MHVDETIRELKMNRRGTRVRDRAKGSDPIGAGEGARCKLTLHMHFGGDWLGVVSQALIHARADHSLGPLTPSRQRQQIPLVACVWEIVSVLCIDRGREILRKSSSRNPRIIAGTENCRVLNQRSHLPRLHIEGKQCKEQAEYPNHPRKQEISLFHDSSTIDGSRT